jgi:hypothetical protein
VQFGRDVAADARERGLAVARGGDAEFVSVIFGILLSLVTGCLVPAYVVGAVAGPDAESVGPYGALPRRRTDSRERRRRAAQETPSPVG